MGAGAAATRRTSQIRAKEAADAAPLAGNGRGSWWACCNSRLLGRSTSTTSCLLPAGRWHRSGVRAGPDRAAPVAGAVGKHLRPSLLGVARAPSRVRARGKPVEKLVQRNLGKCPVPAHSFPGALIALQMLLSHLLPDPSTIHPSFLSPTVRRLDFPAPWPERQRHGGAEVFARRGGAFDGKHQSTPLGECKFAPSHPTAPRPVCLLTGCRVLLRPPGRV